MNLQRRDLLRLLTIASLASTAACADDDTNNSSPDAGGTPDAGGDDTGGSDAGGNDTGGSDTGEPDADPPNPLPDEPPPEYEYDGPLGPADLFSHGVASGDPWPESVVLWTRVTTAETAPIEVFWEIAIDPEFVGRVASGYVMTDGDRDWTVKIEAENLLPGFTYYYRFFCQGRSSLVGRTRTAPVGDVERLRFAVVSCSNLPNGYFNAYRAIAERADLDIVLHLGDYIYEYGGGSGARAHFPPREIISLTDYRQRYGQYRRDTDLQAVHQQHPFVPVWDDHESANNSWPGGAQNHNEGEGDWDVRKAASIQAWFEWMPVRDNAEDRIWRTLRYGNLMDLVMLDTRLWGRDEELSIGDREGLADETRTLLGDDQEAWLADQLSGSTATWRVIGQQVMMGQLLLRGAIVNPDQWDGYPGSRNRFLDVLERENVDNVVVLTGDIHTSWAMDIARDPNNRAAYDPETGRGSYAVEFVTPSVTSSALGFVTERILGLVLSNNPHMKWVELTQKGYVLVDVTPERVHGEWYFVSTIQTPDFRDEFVRGFATLSGTNHLVPIDSPASAPANPPAPAPGMPARPA